MRAGKAPGRPPGRHDLSAAGAGQPSAHRPGLLLFEQPQLCVPRRPLHRLPAHRYLQRPHAGGSGGGGHAVRIPRPAVRAVHAAGAGRHPEHSPKPVRPVPPVPGEH